MKVQGCKCSKEISVYVLFWFFSHSKGDCYFKMSSLKFPITIFSFSYWLNTLCYCRHAVYRAEIEATGSWTWLLVSFPFWILLLYQHVALLHGTHFHASVVSVAYKHLIYLDFVLLHGEIVFESAYFENFFLWYETQNLILYHYLFATLPNSFTGSQEGRKICGIIA